mmetsp:Transcript_8615/g.11970  ORF Transcript_8615/g.11970 Transcript_8615/m.11970 type:complete len:274 (-) Transcript_8615:110-931(-)
MLRNVAGRVCTAGVCLLTTTTRCQCDDDHRKLRLLEARVEALERGMIARGLSPQNLMKKMHDPTTKNLDGAQIVQSSWARSVLKDEALFTQAEIQTTIQRLGEEISAAYSHADGEVVLIGLLDGVFMFLSDLARAIKVPHEIDFVKVSSYGLGTVSSGNIRIKKDTDHSVAGKHVLIVDDICDSGYTSASLVELFERRGAKSVKTCVFLDKRARRQVPVHLDFVGYQCSDEFVIGYGMDWAGKYRSLPFIGAVKPHLYATPNALSPSTNVSAK